MPRIRCMFYTDSGEPLGGGCRRIGAGCEFVHPSDPLWATAPPGKNRFQPGAGGGRGRGRDSGTMGGGSDNAAASPWGSTSSSTTGSFKTLSTAPKGPRKKSQSGWGDNGSDSGWGNFRASASSGWADAVSKASGSGVPQEVRTETDTSTTAAQSDWGWATPRATSSGWGSPPPGGWPQSDALGGSWGVGTTTAKGAQDEKGKSKDQVKGADPWGSWSTSAPNATETTSTTGKGQGKDQDKGSDPWGFGSAPTPNTTGTTSAAGKWDISEAGSMSQSGGEDAPLPPLPPSAARKTAQGSPRVPSPAPPSPTKSDRPWAPSSPTRSERSDRPFHDRRDSVAFPNVESRKALPALRIPSAEPSSSTAVSPFASLLDSTSATPKQSSTFSDLGYGITRVASPSPSPTESSSESQAQPEHLWGKYIKTIERAIFYKHELAAAEEKRVRIRRLQKSRQFQSTGHKSRDKLEGLRIDHEKTVGKLQQRMSDVIKTLLEFPDDMQPPDPSVDAKDIDDLKRFSVELTGWMDTMRPMITDLQEGTKKAVPQVPLKRKRETTEDNEMDDLYELMLKLTTKADDLDIYLQDLKQSSRDAVAGAVIKLLPRSIPPVPGEDAEVLPFTSTTPIHSAPPDPELVPDPAKLQRGITEQHVVLTQLQDDLRRLREQDQQMEQRSEKLVAENEELKLRLARLEQEQEECKKVVADPQRNQNLRRTADDLLHLPCRAFTPPQEVLDQLAMQLRESMRADVVESISAMREGVELRLRLQQQTVLNNLLARLQPSLQTIDLAQGFMDTQEFTLKDGKSKATADESLDTELQLLY